MLKFVGAFCSVESRRSFFKSFGHFKELLSPKLEVRNHAEAIAIAQSKGDLLLEGELLEKSGNYKDASLLLLLYVFANSLWSSKSKGWPLKAFKNKEQLLTRARSLAKYDSDSFYEVVCVEANNLSNKYESLSKMSQKFKDSEYLKSIGGIVLSSWKILDSHFLLRETNYNWEIESVDNLKKLSEATMSQNKVSAQTLMYFWKSWKDNIVKIFDYLSSFEARDGTNYENYETFCLSFLGVRKQVDDKQSSVYLLINWDAEWVREFDAELGSKQGKAAMVWLTSREFVSSARNYWSSVLLSVWMEVLEKLKSLYLFSVSPPFSELHQSTIATCILEVVECFEKSQFLLCISDNGKVSYKSIIEGMKQFIKTKCTLHGHKLPKSREAMDSKPLLWKPRGCDRKSKKLMEVEAIAVARLDGNILLEVDLLHKNGQHKEAAKLILIFVLANSLWGRSSKGWPLEPFKQREELLSKAKSYAKQDSDNFYDIVSTEVSILYEMENQLIIPQKNRNITTEILLARKILDVHIKLDASKHEWENKVFTDPKNHLEDKIYCEKLSFESLVCYWNMWKDKINQVLRFFECVEAENTNISMVYEESALNYLGARKWLDNKSIYQLLIPDAYWVKRHVDKNSLQRNRDIVTINGRSLALAARKFWSEEVNFVGMQVLKHLGTLQIYAVTNHVSVFHKVSFHLAQVSNFLREFIAKSKFPVDQKLSVVLESSSECFFNCVFALDWIKPVTHGMTFLRETGIFTGLFEEFILKSINSESKLTNEKIGKVVMAVFGSKTINYEIYEKLAERLAVNPPWKAVIDEFRNNMAGESMLIFKLQEALKDYYSKWRKEMNPISPNCFFYIIERQFIFVSSLQGCFYTTRSSFIEWLIAGKTNKNRGKIPSFGEIYDFIADMVNQFLSDDCGAREWIKRANIDSKEYYPLFLLRLIILMCLLCANSDKYYEMLYDLVFWHGISSYLPAEFNVMLDKRRRNDGFVRDLSDVLWKMKNPLVRVDYTGGCRKAMAEKLIDVSFKNDEKEEDLLRVVFGNRNSDEKMTNSSKGKTEWKAVDVNLRNALSNSRS